MLVGWWLVCVVGTEQGEFQSGERERGWSSTTLAHTRIRSPLFQLALPLFSPQSCTSYAAGMDLGRPIGHQEAYTDVSRIYLYFTLASHLIAPSPPLNAAHGLGREVHTLNSTHTCRLKLDQCREDWHRPLHEDGIQLSEEFYFVRVQHRQLRICTALTYIMFIHIMFNGHSYNLHYTV